MDFSVFCREIYSLVSARLPLHLQVETDLRTILHQGGWYYPSSRDRNAYFFDCAGAYKHYVSGMELSLLADALEYAFFCRRWDAGLPLPGMLSKTASPRQWSLRIRPIPPIIFAGTGIFWRPVCGRIPPYPTGAYCRRMWRRMYGRNLSFGNSFGIS